VRPDSPELADAAAAWRGAYLHLPFCARVCPYCDFAVVAGRDDLIDRYVGAVTGEISRDEPFGPIDAVFVGGGTPSMVPPAAVGRLLGALGRRHGLAPGAEITMEANPEDWTAAAAASFRDAGVTRISFGAQSTDPRVLTALGRRHGPREVGRAVRLARDADFASVSIDLIFGHPIETAESWERTLGDVVDVGPDHVSTYALTVERGTPLSRSVAAGAPAPDPDTQADRWEVARDVLGDAGYVRYEVSNHARPGHPCRYNLGVWAGGSYVAYGLGAHGHRDGTRYRNVRSLDAYLDRIEAGESPRAGSDRLDHDEAVLDRAFAGLRRTAGVALEAAVRDRLDSADGRRLVEAGVVEVRDGRLVVSDPLLTDLVARELLTTGG
jgi:putative oxygen-independent coproporphyrinogen III oxidase